MKVSGIGGLARLGGCWNHVGILERAIVETHPGLE